MIYEIVDQLYVFTFFQTMSDNSDLELATEVLWCIQHIEGLIDKGKLSEKKLKEARSCYKLLKNSKTPLPKLRQAMRNSCGDYKAKMLAEDKEVKLDGDKITSCDTSQNQKSNFIKKSASKDDNDSSKNDKVEFKFNFNIEN